MPALRLAHDRSGHQGTEWTTEFLRKSWLGLHKDSLHYCQPCQWLHFAVTSGQGSPTFTTPYSQILPRNGGHGLYATRAGGWSYRTCSSFDRCIVKVLIEEWIKRYDAPHQLYSDQGQSFEATVFKELLRTLTPVEKRRWQNLLPELVFWYNMTAHSTTGISPYHLLFGREARLPIDDLVETEPDQGVPFIQQRIISFIGVNGWVLSIARYKSAWRKFTTDSFSPVYRHSTWWSSATQKLPASSW